MITLTFLLVAVCPSLSGIQQPPGVTTQSTEAGEMLRRATEARQAGDDKLVSEFARGAVASILEGPAIDAFTADNILFKSGSLLQGTQDFDGAATAFKAVAERLERMQPEAFEPLYRAHYAWAWNANAAQRFAETPAAYMAAFRSGSRVLAADDRKLIAFRQEAAKAHQRLGQLDQARAVAEDVLRDAERWIAEDDVLLQHLRLLLASIMEYQGESEQALPILQPALDHLRRIAPAGDPLLLFACQLRGDLLRNIGNYSAAIQDFEMVLEHHVGPPLNPDGTQLLRERLALACKKLGRTDDAIRHLEAMLAEAKKHFPDDPERLLNPAAQLGGCLVDKGDLLRARVVLEDLIERASRHFPETHRIRLQLCGNLAICLAQLGDAQGALELSERILPIVRDQFPPDHPIVIGYLQNLARPLVLLSRYREARDVYRQVLESRRSRHGPKHPDTIDAYMNVATVELALGNADVAVELSETAYEAQRQQSTPDQLKLQAATATYAAACWALGLEERATELSRAALASYQQTSPSNHPDLLVARRNLAHVLHERGLEREALALALEQAPAVREALRLAAAQSSPRELETLAAHLQSDVDLMIEISANTSASEAKALAKETFATVESLRSTARSVGALTRLGVADSAGVAEAESGAVARLAEAVRANSGVDAISAARRELENARRQRMQRLAELPGAAALLEDPSVASICKHLGPDEAAVAYFVHSPIGRAGQKPPNARMLAHVLKADGTLQLFDLGAQADIDQSVDHWRTAMGVTSIRGSSRGLTPAAPNADPRADERAAGEALLAIAWDPLRAVLAGIKKVVIVPDGSLLTVPLDVLPDGPGLLGDRIRIEVRATLQELPWGAPVPREHGVLLAVGGVDFAGDPLTWGATPTSEDSSAAAAGSAPAASSLFLRHSAGFGALPATAAEVRALESLYRETGHEREPITLLGRRASRESLDALTSRARFLHVATHGWFAPEPFAQSDKEVLAPSSYLTTSEQVRGASPMLLCGLALAGADRPPNELGISPGLITAEEVASWNLNGCELAVLSACETSVGLLRSGRGVASLQKALHVAGARTVVTSLWRVPDEATHTLMLDFYQRMWKGGVPKAQALWEAKAMLRSKRSPDGQPLYSTRDWAAWVMTGDPR